MTYIVYAMAGMVAKQTKESRLTLWIAQDDRQLFDAAARVQRESLTQFLVESGSERAERLVAYRTTFSVDSDAHKKILAAIELSAAVCPELVDLFRRPRPE